MGNLHSRAVVAVSAGLLLAASGFVHGWKTDRWRTSQARMEFAQRVPSIPDRIGAWSSEDLPFDDRQLRLAEADAFIHRRYVRAGSTAETVTLIVLAGRAAPLAVHTPDVCFGNIGYHMDGDAVAKTWTETGDSFWQARFYRPPDRGAFRVYWGWSDGGAWQAAADARSRFARRPALYKLYLVGPMTNDERDPARQFLTEALPHLNRCLANP